MAHEFELERTALYALGILPARETEEAEAHLVSCSICMDEYAELRDTASFVALAAELTEDEHAFRIKRIEKKLNIALDRQPRLPQVVVHGYESWYRAVAAAAIVLAIGASVFTASIASKLVATQTALRNSKANQRASAASALEEHRILAALLAPDAHRYEIDNGLIVAHADDVYLALRSLPVLTAGHVLEAWSLAPTATKMTPNAVFMPNTQGQAFVRIPMPSGGIKAIAVTVEPAGGSAQPTTKPLFVQLLM